MPLIDKNLEIKLNTIFAKSAEAAFKATYEFDTSAITEALKTSGDITSSMIDAAINKQKSDMAKAFAKAFADTASADMSKAITDHIKTITLVPTLSAPNGPVGGKIEIT